MTSDQINVVYPPETLEGWYVSHQVFSVDRRAWRMLSTGDRTARRRHATSALAALQAPGESDGTAQGWSAFAELVGSRADLMAVHFRPTLDALADSEAALKAEPIYEYLNVEYSFLSVTEAGLYHLTAQLAREVAAAGGERRVGDEVYRQRLAERVGEELQNPLVRRRLYPEQPPDMPYLCFYPMSKRRAPGQNWYALSLDERSRLMLAHGTTGRKYAGKVQQIITGAIGLDAWEWGVTLFSGDPLEFKKLVTDMRFDEVSAQYAEFGEFYVGKVVRPDEWVGGLG